MTATVAAGEREREREREREVLRRHNQVFDCAHAQTHTKTKQKIAGGGGGGGGGGSPRNKFATCGFRISVQNHLLSIMQLVSYMR